MKSCLLIVGACCCIAPSFLVAQNSPNQQTFRTGAVRIEKNIELTGRLTDPAWQSAPEIDIAYEIQPGENTPSTQKTTAKILYNNEYIYAGFVCRDTDMHQLRANVSDRDKIFNDDWVGFFLDTYGDKQRMYEFIVNPLGIQADLLRSGNNEDASWDAIWQSSGFVSDSLWSVEMAIPLKSIRFPSEKEQNWIILLGRQLPRSSQIIFSWTPFDRNEPCFICQGGTLEGLRNIEASNTFEVLPYIAGIESGALHDTDNPSSPFENGAFQGRIGGGVKYSPNSALVLDAVLNPDFSQVESDASQISVNTTFALFYPEKRPFFLEGTDLFDTRLTVFYSRMINNPIAAAKVTGKSGQLSYAYLAAEDRNTAFIIPGEEQSDFISSSHESFSNIFRARYDASDGSFFGALATIRNLSDAHNYVGGFDWNYRFWGNYNLKGQALLSSTKELNDSELFSDDRVFRNTTSDAGLNGESYNGAAYRVDFQKNARDFSFSMTYEDISPTFQAQSGFINSNDSRRVFVDPNYTWYPNTALVDVAFMSGEAGLHFNYSGELKERYLYLGGGMNMKAQTNWNIGVIPYNQELFEGVFFDDLRRMFFNINSSPSNSFSFGLNGDVGRYIYRDDPPQLGYGHNLSPRLTIKPTEKLQININYSRSRLQSVATNDLFFDGYVARVVGIYQFTQQFFVRLISEYNQFGKTFQIYPLISYKLNPFTIFYAGSTHNLHNFDDPYGVQQTERQFFVKLQYLWRN
jgi:hypothetical protein